MSKMLDLIRESAVPPSVMRSASHGALSVPTGRLSVEWEIHTNGGRSLVLEWIERGGPPVTAPTEHGFGTTLIAQTLKAHGGTAAIRYAKDGVTGVLTLPLSEQARPSFAPASVKEDAPIPVLVAAARASEASGSSSSRTSRWSPWRSSRS